MGVHQLPFTFEQIEQKIIHIDMDCFFAAIEMLDNPEIRHKAVAVGGSPTGRGVLCTANYEARKYGVRSAMSSAEALKKCPHLIFIKPRGSRYKEVSTKILEIFHRYTDKVEPLSLDEAFLDVTNTNSCHGSATLMAQKIRSDIFKETGLTASAGVAPNKFLSKVASDFNKPNGIFVINPSEAANFAKELPIGLVPGIGKVTEKKCHDLGLFKLGDVQHYPLAWLEAKFGKFAHSMYTKSFGIDNRKVGNNGTRKSIGCEETFNSDLMSYNEIKDRLPFLIEELTIRTHEYFKRHSIGPKPTKLFIKVKTNMFNLHTYEKLLRYIPLRIDNEMDLAHSSENLLDNLHTMFNELYTKLEQPPLRLLGVGFRIASNPHQEIERMGQLRLL
ncbi:MAG: DNA polymerase IV [Bacteriovoracaceae bacterium]|nr:DNA polymerase IV [Bacteriovoracaceae bacterium]